MKMVDIVQHRDSVYRDNVHHLKAKEGTKSLDFELLFQLTIYRN